MPNKVKTIFGGEMNKQKDDSSHENTNKNKEIKNSGGKITSSDRN